MQYTRLRLDITRHHIKSNKQKFNTQDPTYIKGPSSQPKHLFLTKHGQSSTKGDLTVSVKILCDAQIRLDITLDIT